MVMGITMAATMIGTLGILIGIFLGVVSGKFKVEVDEKEILICNELPGNNCGGCDHAGRDALAKTIAADQADVGAYPVSDASAAEKIGTIMGIAEGTTEKKVTFVKCKSTCDKTRVQYSYYGMDDCKEVSVVPGADKKTYTCGCMGCGSRVRACVFDAIHVVDGVTVIDKGKCVACGKCVSSCPNNLIELVPYRSGHLVQCSSHTKGRDVKAVCESGCIGYTLCTKQCEFDAIHMENNLTVIDCEKCINCGKCVKKCPVKVIL